MYRTNPPTHSRKIVVLGNRVLACNVLQFLAAQPDVELCVVLNPSDQGVDSPAGVSLKKFLGSQPWRERCTVMQPVKITAPDAVDSLRRFAPDLMLSCSYEKILPQSVIDLCPDAFLNIHFALLPKHRGCFPVVWGIASGDRELGVTLHHVSAGIDDGDIVTQATLPIAADATAQSMYQQCAERATSMFSDFWREWLATSTIRRVPQQLDLGSYHTLKHPYDRWIPWHLSAERVSRVINSLTYFPHPSGRSQCEGRELGLLGPAVALPQASPEPGLVRQDGALCTVDCADGRVVIQQLRLENDQLHGTDLLKAGTKLLSPPTPEYAP